jgi:rubredoxin-NAD+ reductase
MSEPLVIIGTGLAGYTLAREIRKRDTQLPICMISRDDAAYYSKPMLSNALTKHKTPEDLAMSHVDGMRADLSAQILDKTRVARIDPVNHCVQLESAELVPYQRLVLAVGAQPIVLPLAGDAAAQVCHINSLTDYRDFRQLIAGKQSIAVIGPGLIGCEFANDLITAGYEVHVIGPDPWPLGRLLPTQAGAAVQQALQAIGVQWHLQRTVQRVDQAERGLRLLLDNHETIVADVVLSAIGLRPNTSLAQDAGLQVNRGIVVDRTLRSSTEDVYAMGDCAEVGGLVLPFVMPLMHQARALAATLTGATTQLEYPAMPVLVKTTSYPVVVSPPPYDAPGQWQEQRLDDGVQALFKAGEELLGFALTGSAVSEKQALTKQLPKLLD